MENTPGQEDKSRVEGLSSNRISWIKFEGLAPSDLLGPQVGFVTGDDGQVETVLLGGVIEL